MEYDVAASIARHTPLLKSVQQLDLVCPACRGELSRSEIDYSCAECEVTYPSVGGIPDFRVFPDPFLDFNEDLERTEQVLKVLEDHDLQSLLEHYWSLSDITPVNLRKKFVQSAMMGEGRARQQLRYLSDRTKGDESHPVRILEVGAGTGNLLSVAQNSGAQVIGTDIAMRWLHVSRRRFLDQGSPTPPLVCCCAEHLPFRDNTFDVCAIASTLEFVQDPQRALSECARVIQPQGEVLVHAANRYSLGRDPFSGLWGVGYLPRSLQGRYVKWRTAATYDHTMVLSFWELRRLAKVSFAELEFQLLDVDDETLSQVPRRLRMQVRAYRVVKRLPVFASLLRRIGPGWILRLGQPVCNG